MAILKPIKEFKIRDYDHFYNVFEINTNKKGGEDGFDIELIIEELEKKSDEDWLINFIDDKYDGYFIL